MLFGELLPVDKVERIRRELLDEVPDLVLAVGTSALFPYIVAPLARVLERGRLTVEVNPDRTALSERVEFVLAGSAGTWLPLLEEALAD